MYFLLKMGILQPAMLVSQRVQSSYYPKLYIPNFGVLVEFHPENLPQIHKIRFTLPKTNMDSLEKGTPFKHGNFGYLC